MIFNFNIFYFQQLKPNAEGEVNLHDLTKILENLVHEKGDGK